MAYDTLRASGNNQYGAMSDVDKANFGSQQSAQDWVLRKRLQDEVLAKNDTNEAARLAAEQAMQARALAAQQAMGGTFAEKGTQAERLAKLGADQAYGLADRQNAPLMREQDFKEKNYNDEHFLDHFINQAIQQAAGGGAPAAAGMPGAPSMTPAKPGVSAPATSGMSGMAGAFQDPSFLKQIVRGKLGLGQDPDEADKRELNKVMIGHAMEMASNPDPRVRAQGANLLKQHGVNLPASGFAGPGGDPARTVLFLQQPQAGIKIQQLLAHAKRGMGSVRPEIAAQDIKSGLDEIANDAAQFGADPDQIKAAVLQKIQEAIPETNFITDPIRTTLGLGGALFDTSENDLRKNLGF